MQTHDVLRRLRYALDLSDAQVAAMMDDGDAVPTPAEVADMMRPDEDPQLAPCSGRTLERILDGLVRARRGPPPPGRTPPPPLGDDLTNNAILQKLRIAMTFHEKDMLETLALGGLVVSPQELGALFRRPGHKNHRPCGDQLLRNFLVGLAKRERA